MGHHETFQGGIECGSERQIDAATETQTLLVAHIHSLVLAPVMLRPSHTKCHVVAGVPILQQVSWLSSPKTWMDFCSQTSPNSQRADERIIAALHSVPRRVG